jgi:hypothetical protein
MRAVLALAALLAFAPAAQAASGVVESGHHDGGRFAYAIDAPGWKLVPGAPADYTFRLSRGGVTLTVGRAGDRGSAADLAQQFASSGSGRRAVNVDAHHSEVLSRDGKLLMGFADATGPFPVAFLVQAQDGAGASLVRAVAHGARFRWAGPDVRHLPIDPEARRLVLSSNAALERQDGYRDTVYVHDKVAYVAERIRSRHYEYAVYHDQQGVDRQLFTGGHGYERRGTRPCWSHSQNVAGDETFDPIEVPPPGPFVGFGPLRMAGAVLTVQETHWTDQADALQETLSFDPPTHLLLRRTSSIGDEVFSWVPITVRAPRPLCPGTGIGHRRS